MTDESRPSRQLRFTRASTIKPRPYKSSPGRIVAGTGGTQPPYAVGDGWGPWRLDLDEHVIYPAEPYRYEIDLESCTTSAEVLDWICQITSKTWATADHIAGLVRALDDLLNPQAHLCSGGQSKTTTRRQIRQRVAKYVRNTKGGPRLVTDENTNSEKGK